MANDLNVCSFIGNLGQAPETRQVGDTSVTNFSIAVGWKTKTKEGTEWVRCNAWGKLGEICAQYLGKGDKVFISGAMQTREYEKDGSKRYSTEIRVDNMQMLGSKTGSQSQHSPTDAGSGTGSPQLTPPKEDFLDDIPF